MVHGIYVATLVTSSLAMEGVCEQRGYLIQLVPDRRLHLHLHIQLQSLDN